MKRLKNHFEEMIENPKTTIPGLLWLGIGFSELLFKRELSEFSILAFVTGMGFLYSSDSKKKCDKS